MCIDNEDTQVYVNVIAESHSYFQGFIRKNHALEKPISLPKLLSNEGQKMVIQTQEAKHASLHPPTP